jgi:hypothetical protein
MLTTFNESQWINLRWNYDLVLLLACIGFAEANRRQGPSAAREAAASSILPRFRLAADLQYENAENLGCGT